jgi:hypothetical protein
MANILGKIKITAVLLIVFAVMGSSLPARARDSDDKCEQRIHKAEVNLRNAERKHGEHSQQAEQKRKELEEARGKCRPERDHDRDADRARDRDHDRDRDYGDARGREGGRKGDKAGSEGGRKSEAPTPAPTPK